MRVVQIIDGLGLMGGAQHLQVVLAKAFQKKGIEMTVISLTEDGDSPLPDRMRVHGARVFQLPGKLIDLGRFSEMVRLLKSEPFDIVHTHLMHANIIGIWGANLAGIPAVATIHNSHITRKRLHPIRFGLETISLRYLARRVMAVGQITAEAHTRRLGGKEIKVIPNAVDIPEEISPQERLKARIEVMGDPDGILIISVGRLTEQKGYDDLLEAFHQIQGPFPQARLAIVGSGSLQEPLDQKIARLNLEGKAKLLGPRKDVPRLLAASDIFASSSLWEGLPKVVLEAMAAGLPLVVTRVGDNPIVVKNNFGLIVLPGQPDQLAKALNSLAANSELRRSWGRAARDYVLRHHHPDLWAEKIINVYKDVIS
jgi:glycosyltransferase involved in cell wall biosynthesis